MCTFHATSSYVDVIGGNSAGSSAASGGQSIGTGLSGLSSMIRNTASMMEQGTGTLIKFKETMDNMNF